LLKATLCSTATTDSVEVYTSSAQLPSDWDSISALPKELYRCNLSLEQEVSLEHFTYYYLCIRRENQLLACMYFQVVALQADYYPDLSSLSLSAAGFFKYFQGREDRLLICGHVFFNYRKSVHVDPSISEKEADKFYLQCIREAIKISGADIFLAKEPTEDFSRFLAKNARRFLPVGPDNLMTIILRPEWKTPLDYATSLKKKYLQRWKKIRGSAEFWTYKDFTPDELVENSSEIVKAYNNVLNDAEFKLGKLNLGFFHQMLSRNADKFVFRVWFFERKIQGFSSMLVEGNSVELYYIGLPEVENLKRDLYLVMMLNALDFGIENKLHEVRLGRTALEAKAMLGAEPEVLTHYIAFQSRWLKYPALALLKYAGNMIGTGWQTRKPFRFQSPENETT
jgi:hypothetical protein